MTKKFISAGAGSGKTYTITTDVAKMVKDHLLNPDQVRRQKKNWLNLVCIVRLSRWNTPLSAQSTP